MEATKRPISMWLLVGACICTGLIGRVSYVFKPFDRDARVFIYLGKLVTDGGRYCHDVIDNKFPTVGMMTSVPWRMFRTYWPAYVLLQTVMAFAGAVLLARIAARHLGRQAYWPTALYALVYLNFNVAVFGGFQLETLQIFFSILAAGAAAEALRDGKLSDAFVVGLAAGTAMMFKPTGGAVLAAWALATCFASFPNWKRIITQGIAAAGGLAVPAVVVLIYLIRTDILGDMPALSRQISRYATETPIEPIDFAKVFVVAVIAGFPMLVRGWVYRRPAERIEGGATRGFAVFVIAWLVIELLGVVAQRRMYAYHFLVLAPPAALLYGLIPRRDRSMPMVAALVPAIVLSLVGSKQILQEYYPPRYRLAVSDYIAARTTPDDSVWQDYTPRLLLETGCKPGSRIPLTFLFFNYDTAPIEYTDTMLSDFAERRPKYIVLPTDVAHTVQVEMDRSPEMERMPDRCANYCAAWARIDAWVKNHYVAETTIERETVWRLRESSPLPSHEVTEAR